MAWTFSTRLTSRKCSAAMVVAIVLGAGCSGKIDSSAASSSPPFAIAPQIPDVAAMDRDGDRVDDDLLLTTDDARVNVEAIFRQPIGTREIDAFVENGGVVRHVFRAVSYGFVGTIPRSALRHVASSLGSTLLLLKGDRFVEAHLDEATRTGRARPVWANGFAGSALGFNGSPTINIGFLDSGIDSTHPDLAGRLLFWKDYTSEAFATPRDLLGHGSHVAGIALGSGITFGIGPGTLHWTDQGDGSVLASGDWFRAPVHLPTTPFVLTSTAAWLGGGTANLSIMRNGDGLATTYSTAAGPTTGASPLTITWSGPNLASSRISTSLVQNASTSVGLYTIANTVTNYPAVGDGFPAFRGVAPLSGYVAAKIFPTVGVALTSDIAVAMDDMVTMRSLHDIKIVNLSFGASGAGIDTTQRSKANTMVANGIVVVVSNGNNGSTTATADPGRAASVITVGATNDVNQLTQYTSEGVIATSPDEDNKPDILAPGGSFYRSQILSVDSNTADADNAAVADVQPNDYASNSGTSMAAPFVAGSAALLIQALEQSGTPWTFASSDSPLFVKMLLLASATETNTFREAGTGSPTLGRSVTPKDQYEGYGLINPDAALEAVMLPFSGSTFAASTTGSVSDRRAWGRHVTVSAGRTIRLSLTVPATADYDLYLYSPTPALNGNPAILAASDHAGNGVAETLAWTAVTATTTAYVFIKRISGTGGFSLTGDLFMCGDGILEPGEECDDHNSDASTDCCSSTCSIVSSVACAPDGGIADGGVDAGEEDASVDAAAAPDATAPGDASADAGKHQGGTIDGPGADLIPIDLTEGEVAGGGCACETHKPKTSLFGDAMIGACTAFALFFMQLRRRRT